MNYCWIIHWVSLIYRYLNWFLFKMIMQSSTENTTSHINLNLMMVSLKEHRTFNHDLCFFSYFYIHTRAYTHAHTYAHIYIYNLVNLVTVVEGASPFPGSLHFTFDTYLILLSVKQGGIKYHFSILRYDTTLDWTQGSRTISEHSRH